jgi:predicted MFS family arabinose efflux permease
MADPRQPVSRPAVPRPVLLAGLGAAQILGWGTTFYLPSVLGPAMGAALALSQDVIFGGVTVMYLVGAALAPPLGRAIDRHGARAIMSAGSVVAAAALLLLSAAQGLADYAAGWVAIGLMLPMVLGQAGFAAIAQSVPGAGARRAMTLMTLMTGLTATVAWPVTAALEAWLGWRGTLRAFALAHLAVALPLYRLVLPRGAPAHGREAPSGPRPATVTRARFLLLVLALGLPNAVSSGMQLVVIGLLAALGHTPAAAVALAALHGPAQVGARIIDLALGPRTSAMATGLFSAILLPLTVLPLAAGGNTLWAAAFVIAFGVASGLMTVVRAALPLELAGAAGYGALTGRLSLPGNLMVAAAPPLFAATLAHLGPVGAAALTVALALVSLAAMLALALSHRREGAT